MARTDNLTNFLTDVANAIRAKTGETNTIYARDFDTKISSISGSSEPEITTRLPKRYQEVEYIESMDHNNYIDTGVIFPDVKKVRYEFKVKMPDDIRGQAYWGCYMNGGYNGGTLYENRYYVAGDNVLTLALEANGIYEGYAYTDTNTKSGAFYANNGEINETLTYANGALPDSNRAPFCIFCQGTPSGSGINYYNGSKLRVYYFRIYLDDVIVRDFVPCYKKEYNTIGLYDLVNDVFYANQGYGVLEKGEDVNVEIEPEKILPYNIFVQEQEPKNKNGLWLQTDLPYEQIVNVPYVDSLTWTVEKKRTKIPYSFYGASGGQRVGDYMYLFGTNYDNSSGTAYKYHLFDDTFTQITTAPIYVGNGSSAAIGTDIYIGGGLNSAEFVKYDTLTGKYTTLARPSIPLYGVAFAAVGNYIYTFGGLLYESDMQDIWKYDPANNTWTKLSVKAPIKYSLCNPIVVGTEVYLIGMRCANHTTTTEGYKFDTTTQTFTKLSPTPPNFYTTTNLVDGNIIYLWGNGAPGGNAYSSYMYNIQEDTYTQLEDLPYDLSYSETATKIDNEILIFGGLGEPTTVFSLYRPEPVEEEYTKNTVVLYENIKATNTDPKITLINSDVSLLGFDNYIIYAPHNIKYKNSSNEEITGISAYYGDGTEWKKLNN